MDEPPEVTYADLQSLGKFHKPPLGSGTFGIVEKWTSNVTGKDYAVKKFTRSDYGEVPADALREIAILRALKHPNIIQILDVGNAETDSNAPLEMVLPLGLGDLSILTRQDTTYYFDLPKFKHLAYQLCAGLNYLHDRGVIHRDLKPGNIIVLPGPIPVIADLGSARFGAIPGGKYTNGVQTMWWRAPENLLSENSLQDYTSKIDVFSLGIILMELFCSVYPVFGTQLPRDVLRMQISLLGHFNEQDYPGVTESPAFKADPRLVMYAAEPSRQAGKFEYKIFSRYRGRSADMEPELKELMVRMTYPNPKGRIPMTEVVSNPWWDDIRSKKNILKPARCGSSYNIAKLSTPIDFLKQEPIPIRRVVLDFGWDMCNKLRFGITTKMHYRFLYEQFRRRFSELARANDPLLQEIEPIAADNIALIIYVCVHISSLLYEVKSLHIEDLLKFLQPLPTKTEITLRRLVKLMRGIVKILKFDVAFNTYVEYNQAFLERQQLDPRVIVDTDTIAKIFYLMEVEVELNSEKLARLSLELACRAHGLQNPECLRDSPFKPSEIASFTNRFVEYVMYLRDPLYSNPREFTTLKQDLATPAFRLLLENILRPAVSSGKVSPVLIAPAELKPVRTRLPYEVPLVLEILGVSLPNTSMVFPQGATALTFERALQNITKDTLAKTMATLLHTYAASVAEIIEKAYPTALTRLAEVTAYFNLEKVGGTTKYRWNNQFNPNIEFVFEQVTAQTKLKLFLSEASEAVGKATSEIRNKMSIGLFSPLQIGQLSVRLSVPN